MVGGYASLGLLHLLWELFDQVIVTEAVYAEMVVQGRNRMGKEELETSGNKYGKKCTLRE